MPSDLTTGNCLTQSRRGGAAISPGQRRRGFYKKRKRQGLVTCPKYCADHRRPAPWDKANQTRTLGLNAGVQRIWNRRSFTRDTNQIP